MVKTSVDGTPVAVPSETLAQVTEEKAAEIGQKVGGKVLEAKPKPAPIKVTPTSEARKGRTNGGLIAGVVVAVALLVIIAAVTVWYFRYGILPFVISFRTFQ